MKRLFYKLLNEIFEEHNFDDWNYSRHKKIGDEWNEG